MLMQTNPNCTRTDHGAEVGPSHAMAHMGNRNLCPGPHLPIVEGGVLEKASSGRVWGAGDEASLVFRPTSSCCVSCWRLSHCRVWGGPMPSCFAACAPPSFGLFLFLPACSLLLVCGAGAVACRSPHPIVAVGLSHSQWGGARGTGDFCTCLQIYKLTCHWCLLGLF